MITFKVRTLGYALPLITASHVTDTFNVISAYIKTLNAADVNPANGLGVIKLGDYVELPSLSVVEYNGNGGAVDITSNADDGKLRLVVVGINPYYDKNGNGTTTPHLIFHFKDFPGSARMEATNTNANGYLGSEMRAYLTTNYWPALQAAGVPDTVVWPVSRRVANKGGFFADDTHTIEDKLWLPTEREMFGDDWDADYNQETNINQTHFAYYDNDIKRIKSNQYWEASPSRAFTTRFCITYLGIATLPINASMVYGCAPAFAVK
jgi:hypothetical protein